MRTFSAVLSLTALLAAASALHAETATERGERQLARMLGDRVAGPPVDCFEYVSATKKIEIDGVALVYDTGDVVYVAPDDKHQFRNTGSTPFKMLCLIPNSATDKKVTVVPECGLEPARP